MAARKLTDAPVFDEHPEAQLWGASDPDVGEAYWDQIWNESADDSDEDDE